MNAWLALTKKEFRLGLPAFLVALVLFAGIITGGYYLGNHLGYQNELIMTALAMVVMLHLFFLTFYLYYSLNAERKRLHLWLHNPMSIGGLLISKMFTGIVFMAITFITSLILAVMFFKNHFGIFNEQTTFNILGLSTVSIFISSLSIAVTFIFFWSIFLTYNQRMNDFLSFMVTFILFLLLAFFYEKFTHLAFMETLTNWGAIQIKDVIMGFELSFMEDAFEAETMSETSIFYIGHFLRDFVVAVFMFIAACWIIDKKVEV